MNANHFGLVSIASAISIGLVGIACGGKVVFEVGGAGGTGGTSSSPSSGVTKGSSTTHAVGSTIAVTNGVGVTEGVGVTAVSVAGVTTNGVSTTNGVTTGVSTTGVSTTAVSTTNGVVSSAVATTGSGTNCLLTCQMQHQGGFIVLAEASVQSCGCQSGSPCNTECENTPACAFPPGIPGGQCGGCLFMQLQMGPSACEINAALSPECQGNAECSAFVTCILGCA